MNRKAYPYMSTNIIKISLNRLFKYSLNYFVDLSQVDPKLFTCYDLNPNLLLNLGYGSELRITSNFKYEVLRLGMLNK
jgi:hypothetical protein